MEGYGRSFPDTRLPFQVRKVMGGGGGGCVTCRIIVSALVSPFPPDFGFGTCIWDLDLGLL